MRGRTIRRLLGGAAAIVAFAASVPATAQTARIGWVTPAPLDEYALIDRADALSEAIGDAPPDYAFAYDGAEPWSWTAEDGSVLIVEQDENGPHGYYFDPGSDTPYLVRETDRSFGYSRGLLAVVYDGDGRVMARGEADSWGGEATEGYARGRALKRAMVRREAWNDVPASAWIDFVFFLNDWDRQWETGRRRYPGWARHRRTPGAIYVHRRFEHDGRRWLGQQQQFQRWQENGYQGPAPGRWTAPVPGEWHPEGRGRDGAGRPGMGRFGGNGARPDRPGGPRPGGRSPRTDAPVLPPVPAPAPSAYGPVTPPPSVPWSTRGPNKPGMPQADLPVENDAPAPVPGTMGPNQPRPARTPWTGAADHPRPVPQAMPQPGPAMQPMPSAQPQVFSRAPDVSRPERPASTERPHYTRPASTDSPSAPPPPPPPRSDPPSPPPSPPSHKQMSDVPEP